MTVSGTLPIVMVCPTASRAPNSSCAVVLASTMTAA
jgi:hypothetical protein